MVTTRAEININKVVILDGEGRLSVDGGNDHRVFTVSIGGEAPSGDPNMVELRGLFVRGGRAEAGGGIYNNGTLLLIDSTVSGNTAEGETAGGGGIYNRLGAKLTLINCFVLENSATRSGGGISNVYVGRRFRTRGRAC